MCLAASRAFRERHVSSGSDLETTFWAKMVFSSDENWVRKSANFSVVNAEKQNQIKLIVVSEVFEVKFCK